MARLIPLAYRTRDLADLEVIADTMEGVVLVITGAPGVGKSALAAELARKRGGRAKTVALSALESVAELEDALAAIRDGAGDDGALPEILVGDDLRSKAIGAVFAALAERNPETTVIVTTHDRALVPGARVHEVKALTPDDGAALLTELARAIDPAWAPASADGPNLRAIAELASGLPLGLELAAARLPILGARALRFRLEKSFDVLARGAGGGRSALELAIATAIEALEPGPREALAQLALFTHPFSAAAAEGTVVLRGDARVLDALAALRSASLLEADTIDGEVRFFVPTAIARVAASEAQRSAFDERHAEYYAALAERSERDELWRERAQILDVARRVLGVKPLTASRAEPALRALLALGPRLFDEASTETLDAIATATLAATQGSGARPGLIAGLQWLRGALARRRGDERASNELVAALSVARTIGDRFLDARCTVELGHLLARRGELAEAEAHFTRASEVLLGDERAAALAAAADAARERDDFFQAMLHVVRGQELDPHHPAVEAAATALALDEGNPGARAKARGVALGHALHDEGDLDGARAAYRTASAGGFEGIVALEANASVDAWVLLGDAIVRGRGSIESALFSGYLAVLAERLGKHDEAARRREDARTIAKSVRRPWLDAALAILRGEASEARSVHVRIARRIASGAKPVVVAPRLDALIVGEGGAWFRAPGAEKAQPLRARKNLARILDAMAKQPERTFDTSALFAIGWPGERALGPSSAHRVRVALATLRKMGLDAQILRKDDGWCLGGPIERAS